MIDGLEERIAAVRDLLEARDEIEAQLDELLGGEAGEVEAPKKKYKKRQPKAEAPVAEPEKKKAAGCDECGSKGFRHYKTCSKDGKNKRGVSAGEDPVAAMRGGHKMSLEHGNDEWQALGDEPKRGEVMSEDVFDAIKEKQQAGVTPLQCSVEHGLNIKQVNVAFGVSRYETYLEFATVQ